MLTSDRRFDLFSHSGFILLYINKSLNDWHVGCDPLSGDDVRQQQMKHLFSEGHCFEDIFEDIFTAVVSGDHSPFKRGLEYSMRLTYSL